MKSRFTAAWLELGCRQLVCRVEEVAEVGEEPLLGWMGVTQEWQQGSLSHKHTDEDSGEQLKCTVSLEPALGSVSKAVEARAVPGDGGPQP